MIEPQQIVNPGDARVFLADISKTIRKRGEDYYRKGLVDRITVLEPGWHFEVRVRGSRAYLVDLCYDNEFEQWEAFCSCPFEFGTCKHAYAAMKTLLDGVDGELPAKTKKPKRSKAKKVAGAGALQERLTVAKGKKLLQKEERFIAEIAALHAEFSRGQYPYFQRLTRVFTGHYRDPWAELTLWPEPPTDDHELWLYLVNFAQDNNLHFPAFMKPVSDLEPIREKIEKLHRQHAIDGWHRFMEGSAFPSYSIEEAARPAARSELRLRLDSDGAFLELLEPPRTEFRRLTHPEFRNLDQRVREDELFLDERSELLWGLLKHRAYSNYSLRLKYDDFAACRTLYRVFDSAALREAMVDAEGAPVKWSSRPLRWNLSESADRESFYHLTLVHEDGTSVSSLAFALTGAPSYYLVNDTMHPGPPFDSTQLNPREEILLPSEIVEHRDGIGFLHGLGTRLPEALARRVQTIKLHPRLSCRLEEKYQEQCVIEIESVGPDGQEFERWFNRRWQPIAGSASEPAEDQVRILDRRALACVPSIMDGLNTGADWEGRFRVQIGKKFPERFTTWLESLPPSVEIRLSNELAGFREPAMRASVSLNVEETEIDWFDLKVELNIEDTDLTKEEIKLLLAAKGNWVRLDKKGWRRLEFDVSEEDDEQLARLGLNPRSLDGEPQRLHALQLANPSAKKFLPDDQCKQLTRRAEEIQARVTPEIPNSIEAELRPYQAEGFHFLAYLSSNRFGGILADDMGLGKTLQTLTWLMWLREHEEAGPALVVCPKSVMDNWQAEAKRFAKELRTRVWQRKEVEHLPDNTHMADLHVINYNQLRKLGESLHPVRFQAVVLDEGQHIKNPSSQTAQAARGLKAGHRLVLTGTPIENRLLDLWSLMTFAMPGVLGSRSQFGKLYNAKDDPFARLRLSSRVRPFLIRRTKSQVAQDLPDRIEEDLYCEIEGEQKKLYQAERKRAQQILLGIKTQKQLNELRFNFLTSLLHLRQICCHPRLFHESTRAKSAKMEALLEQLEPIMAEGGKVLIFSQFVELLELIDQELESQGYEHWKLTGSTENRGKLVESFQNHDGSGVFLISLKAGGSGLNLTAASYVVLFDPWWNPAVENQAIDRTHRIGQTTKVIAYRLLIKNSIEEKIRELQKQKQALAEDVLGEEKFSAALSLSDFQYLLSD